MSFSLASAHRECAWYHSCALSHLMPPPPTGLDYRSAHLTSEMRRALVADDSRAGQTDAVAEVMVDARALGRPDVHGIHRAQCASLLGSGFGSGRSGGVRSSVRLSTAAATARLGWRLCMLMGLQPSNSSGSVPGAAGVATSLVCLVVGDGWCQRRSTDAASGSNGGGFGGSGRRHDAQRATIAAAAGQAAVVGQAAAVGRPPDLTRSMAEQLTADQAAALDPSSLAAMLRNDSALKAWQATKAQANPAWVRKVDHHVERELRQRLSDVNLRGLSVLCVGARAGGEVRALRSAGAFAVGIDLQPAADTNLVLVGDAERLQFADGSVDRVFTNILDHLPRLHRFAHEVARVLKPGGYFVADVHLQLRESDAWSVRDTGTPAFYRELATALQAAGLVQRCTATLTRASRR